MPLSLVLWTLSGLDFCWRRSHIRRNLSAPWGPLDGHETIRNGGPQANTFCLMYELALASGVSVAKLAIVSGVSVALVAKFPPTDAAGFTAKVLFGKYLRPFELHSLMQPRRARAAYKRWKLRLHHHGSN